MRNVRDCGVEAICADAAPAKRSSTRLQSSCVHLVPVYPSMGDTVNIVDCVSSLLSASALFRRGVFA